MSENRFHGIDKHRILSSSLVLSAGAFVLTSAPLEFRYFHVFIAVYAVILFASRWFCAGARSSRPGGLPLFELRGALAVAGCLVLMTFADARPEIPLANLLAWPIAVAMFCGAADGWLLRGTPLASVPGLLKAGFAAPRTERKG